VKGRILEIDEHTAFVDFNAGVESVMAVEPDQSITVEMQGEFKVARAEATSGKSPL
jgi:hypothetical protein